MNFGDSQDFAIEAYHEPSGPQWAGYGRLCIYIAGICIGDIRDNHCSLFHPTDRFRELIRNLASLWDEAFAGLSDGEIFGIIDDELYIGDSPNIEKSHLEFDFLTNTAEMFDGTKTFIYCTPSGQVHILSRFSDDSFQSGTCSVQTFRSVAQTYVNWFHDQIQNVGQPFFRINPFDTDEKVPGEWSG